MEIKFNFNMKTKKKSGKCQKNLKIGQCGVENLWK